MWIIKLIEKSLRIPTGQPEAVIRTYNGKKLKGKRTHNDIQNIIQKTTDRETRIPLTSHPNIHCHATCMTSFKDGDIFARLCIRSTS